ncbi:MAG: RNA-binding domain-containing protein [Nitrososphaera sp.]|jgi:RNA binding exosome subunit
MSNQVEVTTEIIFHATEDTKKVLEPLVELFQLEENEFLTEKILGHYGNPILLVKNRLTKKRAVKFIDDLVSRIPKAQLNDLINNIEMYFEDSSLFLRIGKNEIVRKEVSMQQTNAIKIKIKIPIYKKDEIVKTYVNLLQS